MKEERILEQLDKMVASGRVSEGEAAALRAAAGTDEFERAVGAIRAATPASTWTAPLPPAT